VTAIEIEHRPASLLSGRRAVAPAAKSPELEERLRARRRRIASFRRVFVLVDLAVTLGVVAVLALVAGHRVAAGMALLVSLGVVAHVCAADGPRSVLALRSVLRPVTALSGLACTLAAALGYGATGRDLVLGAAGTGVALVATRVVARVTARLPWFAARSGFGPRKRLIVGDPRALESTAARRAPGVESGEVILVVTRAERAADPGAEPGLGTREEQRRRHDERNGPSGVVERVVRTALDNHAERVTVIPGDSWQQRQLRELSWLLEGTGIDIVISTNLDGIAPHRVDVVQQDRRLMIKVGSASPRGTQALVKGLVDRLAAATLLLVSFPFLVAVAAAVRLDSPGPAVFRQSRVREGGGTFTMYKFRTMRVDAEQQLDELQDLDVHGAGSPLFKIEGDPRITRVGQLLRKTSLDELPQLVNVLKGDMSLVGPRPPLQHEVAQYDDAMARRLRVRPGITGLWQVSGRSDLAWSEAIRLDLYYVDNWSMFQDLTILARTFGAVFGKHGAY